ncbi:murein biosynthesis integral membrane protein MurJ [Neptuniibacter sp. CAU 1671]|uniref:murein biosynthesis integral membrane protein MurJ n=1 Tax=Neptuniibacter sp. CAU 1671 TaxID=3032593 RepID=UPI0023DA944D|nr:murein biosynthesis integral membrane protein MurJ [Neptuniibacter sp. CAU 1671]MDF2182336.1 murein biosynthesis integral membrane protein MurJ [Neptuniibacter sp. CAU 1671]
MQTDKPKDREAGLLRSSAVVGLMTMLSRIMGLARDVVVAGYFGAGSSADAFFVAFKIPNFLRRLFAEGAFAQAFVPVLSEYRTQRDLNAVKALIDRVAGTLGGILIMVTVVAVTAAPVITALFAPGFYLNDSQKFALAVDMLRLTFPYLLLISLTAFAGSILNSYGRFAVPAVTPVFLNASLIGAAIFLSPLFDPPVLALAWGVMIAGVTQLIFQLPFLARLALLPRPIWGWGDEGVRRIMKLMLPALFGVSVTQISLLLDTVLASFLQTGSVSWLYYSDRLSELPLGVFGIAIATVILPSLSRKHAAQSPQAFSDTLNWALQLVLLIGVPAALALLCLAEPLLITLFHYGAMQERDVWMAGMSLRAYACGLVAFMLIKVLATGYFSRQDTKTPVKIGLQAVAANMALNLLLIGPLQHVGLAAATSLSAFLNAGLLLLGLRKLGILTWSAGWGAHLLRLLLANLALAGWVLWQVAPATEWFEMDVWQRVLNMTWLVGTGVLLYLLVLVTCGLRLHHLRQH